MSSKRALWEAIGLAIVVLLMTGCGGAMAEPIATSTPAPPTPAPPTATAAPTEAADVYPAARFGHQMAYDAESDQVILFGGITEHLIDPANATGQTWAYDPAANRWREMTPASSPGARACAAMAYDAESDRVILFGGEFGSDRHPVEGTWAYDLNSNTWTETMPTESPRPRAWNRMVYDAESDVIIMFGGSPGSSETWAYDFNTNTWTKMKPDVRPPGRMQHPMAYDGESDRVIVWSGNLSYESDEGTVWAYDFNTNTWIEMESTEGPELRADSVMVYDAESDRTILFGGLGTFGSSDTWAYDLNTNTWTELDPSIAPEAINIHAMAYGAASDRVILFGGRRRDDNSDETWLYDFNANTWTNVTPNP